MGISANIEFGKEEIPNTLAARLTFSDDTEFVTLDFRLGQQVVPISVAVRSGGPHSLLYFHGLGSTKFDFAVATRINALKEYTIIAFDYPGSGDSGYPHDSPVTVSDVADVASAIITNFCLRETTFVAHSMGGVVALLTARIHPEIVRTMINVEGNLAPIDCAIFSRAAAAMTLEKFQRGFFDQLQSDYFASEKSGFWTFGKLFRKSVTQQAFYYYCKSLVALTDSAPLLRWFSDYNIPRLFVYGSENRSLPYLRDLRDAGVSLAEIRDSNHFPVYSNAHGFFTAIVDFLELANWSV